MPFKSERQRRYMHAKLPELAAKWEHETRPKKKRPKPKRKARSK